MEDNCHLYSEIRLFRTEEKLILFGSWPVKSNPRTLIVDRKTKKISFGTVDEIKNLNAESETIFGLIGMIRLASGCYLVIVKERTLVGMIDGHYIYKLIQPAFCLVEPPSNNTSGSGDSQKRQDRSFLNLLDSLLKSKDFYFSYTFDLTNSLSRQEMSASKKQPLWMKADRRFFWNEKLLEEFIKVNASEFLLPIIRGCVQIFIVIVQRKMFDYILLSRRSKYRAGTRYETRGVDSTGQVANYVETEQIVLINGHRLSFVQTRGSVPLLWEQSGLKYTPIPRINPDTQLNSKCFTLHFKEQFDIYQHQVVVNLLDQKGVELPLAQAYEKHLLTDIEDKSKITYRAFDFHTECRGNNYDNVSILINALADTLDKLKYFHMTPNGEIVSTQSGVVRTNCLDCLDRTNLVQSFIGRYILKQQLILFGIQVEDKDSVLEKIFKEAWANNGDAISLQYAGTGALKNDFTRTGKITAKGAVKDSVRGISRYFVNNFRDRLRQIGIDLFLGNYELNNRLLRDSDMLEQTGQWNEEQMKAIEVCTQFIEEGSSEDFESTLSKENSLIKTDAIPMTVSKDSINLLNVDEQIVNAWVVISINKRNREQERILVLTSQGVYRFKYNWKTKKIVHYKKFLFHEMLGIHKGPFKGDKRRQRWGLTFILDPNLNKTAHVYSPLDFSKSGTDKMAEVIREAGENFYKLLVLGDQSSTSPRNSTEHTLNNVSTSSTPNMNNNRNNYSQVASSEQPSKSDSSNNKTVVVDSYFPVIEAELDRKQVAKSGSSLKVKRPQDLLQRVGNMQISGSSTSNERQSLGERNSES